MSVLFPNVKVKSSLPIVTNSDPLPHLIEIGSTYSNSPLILRAAFTDIKLKVEQLSRIARNKLLKFSNLKFTQGIEKLTNAVDNRGWSLHDSGLRSLNYVGAVRNNSDFVNEKLDLNFENFGSDSDVCIVC